MNEMLVSGRSGAESRKGNLKCSWSYLSGSAGSFDSRNGRDSAEIETMVMLERTHSLQEVIDVRSMHPKFIREIGQSALKVKKGKDHLEVGKVQSPLKSSVKSTSVLNVATNHATPFRSDENLGAVSSICSGMMDDEKGLLEQLQFSEMNIPQSLYNQFSNNMNKNASFKDTLAPTAATNTVTAVNVLPSSTLLYSILNYNHVKENALN